MWKVTLKGILARKVRLVLTALAVLLGVSFVSATYVLTDTLDHSFRGLFRDQVAGVDVVVQQRPPFGGDTGRERFGAEVVDEIQAVPGVATAYGVIRDYAQFVDKQGESIQLGGAPTQGISWSQEGTEGPLHLIADEGRRGRPPRGRHEVAMDISTARENDFHIGDHVRVLLTGPAERFKIVGLFGFGDRVELGAVTFAAFDLETAQELFSAPDLVDFVYVVRAPGLSVAELRTRVIDVVGPAFEVTSAAEFAADRGDQIVDFLDRLTQVLLGFALIGLVVGAFIIFNTFTILVTQRTRELGLLRAMGATGRQVVLSVVIEAAVMGAIASAGGVLLGLGFAAGLFALLESAGRDIPEGLVLADRTVILSLAVGVLMTVASSVWPAVRASRVPPMAAINDVQPARTRPFRRRALLGSLCLVVGIAALSVGIDRAHESADVIAELVDLFVFELPIIALVALGALLVFFGIILLLAVFARPLAGALGIPLRAIDVTGVLARGNAMRNPRRTAATASALVIGLALIGLVSTFGASVKASVTEAIDSGIRGDFVLKAQQFSGFSSEVAERLQSLPELDAVAAFRYGNTRVNTVEEVVAGVSAGQLAPVVDLGLVEGTIADLAESGVLVHRDAAKRYEVDVGDSLTIQFTRGFQTLRVAGIYTQEDFTGGLPVDFVVSERSYDEGFGADEQDVLVYVKASGSVRAARSAIEGALGRDFPNVEVFTTDEYRADQEAAIDQFLAVTIALLVLSVIIALLGVVNTLALSVYERTHELGLLRAVGMSRRQLRRMVRGESVLIAVIGGIIGAAIGVLWGWAFTSALSTQGITRIEIPVSQLVVFVLLSMLAGVGAALAPAWRASRLDVLSAITTE